ncbi:MAG: class I SAM-dependent methyltransferase [Anaerolineae bacterium]|nr:class I SAM-dependent methyltransferase [Anaerolineae bacterium]
MNPREYEIMYQLEDEHWWYQAIHQLIFSTLTRLHQAQGQPDWLILDGGCGTGAIAHQLKQFGQVRAVDLSGLALHFSQRRGLQGQLAQASITAIPMPANTFDLAVSIDVMCSVPNDRQALVEFHRVLKPGGFLLLNLPALRWLKGQHDLAVHILHRYAPKPLKTQLKQQGFTVEKISFANSLLFPLVAPYRVATNWLLADEDDTPRSDVFMPPKLMNHILGWVMKQESRLIPRFSLPIGMSLFVMARKHKAVNELASKPSAQ